MTVDLDRLGEAMWDIDCPEEHGQLVRAVLDAPTVWWCAGPMIGYGRPYPGDCDGTEERFSDGSVNRHDTCGWVVLVPVKGGHA